LQPHGVEPELGGVTVALDVDVWRLAPIAGIKEDLYGPSLSTVGIVQFATRRR